MKIKTNIIPSSITYIGKNGTLDRKAICIYTAIGFFLNQDTFFNEKKTLKPFSESVVDDTEGKILSQTEYFKWHYSPVERPLNQIVLEFAELFETIIKEQVGDKKVILPLSGGLDSRTQAAALYHLGNEVSSYSYAFTNGHDETFYSKKIAEACQFPFEEWKVSEGYLWESIEDLASINGCYSEFTHPRQMAFVNRFSSMGDVFCLGHWGDVLFDDMGVQDHLSDEEQIAVIIKKITKKGGLELAESLWESWGIEGSFKEYLYLRVKQLFDEISISNSANSKIRAFKSTYWATRWTTTNLSVFQSVKPIALPYYDNRMCEFICSIPERYLSGRQIQIEYLKLRMPSLAKIAWQDHRPFNLYNYKWNKKPYNLPYKVYNKISRLLSSKKYIQRNWELQFLGEYNERMLEQWLFENEKFESFIDSKIVTNFYKKFKNDDSVYYSHSVSILLTLSLFAKKNL